MKRIYCILISLVFINATKAQHFLTEDYNSTQRFSIYQCNPLTLYLFERIKLEYRIDKKNAIYIAGNQDRSMITVLSFYFGFNL